MTLDVGERLCRPKIQPDARSARGRIIALYVGLITFNLAVWVWALIACRGRYLLLGTALAAYGFGLRHAVDADHIAAIDNVTRKLMQERQRPLGAGLYFALGHSSVVILASVAVAFTTSSVGAHLREARELGATLGTVISFGFLWLIGTANVLSLPSTLAALRQARRGGGCDAPDLEAVLAQQGVLARWLQPVFRLVRRSRDMFPLGALFGLGFDTASEVLLLGISAAQVSHGMPIASTLLFPALFTAGMTLIDTSDGLLMTGAYGWAFINPVRKLRYNLIVTVLSVAVAFLVGGVEALGLIRDRLGVEGSLARHIAAWNGHPEALGFGVIGLFLFCWLVSAGAHRWGAWRATGLGQRP
jgi:nickel/cobalt transporter (NiCoT) family protein